jgi:hypothetical protein
MKSPATKKTSAKGAANIRFPDEVLRGWLLGAFVAVCVGRVLVPSEAVSWQGDGHPFTLLLLLLAGGYFVVVLRRGGWSRSWGLVDTAVVVLALVCITSATLGVIATLFDAGNNPEFETRVASPRPAINMAWEWTGLALVFFLARQLIANSLETRALVAVMIALAVVVSGLGLYQIFVSLPADRAAYAENPDEMLRRIGQWYPPGSPERARFEDRLNSTEPLGTFALANSLAGFLAPWLIVGLGVLGSIVFARAGRKAESTAADNRFWAARTAGLGICLVAVFVCVLLTKSRTAYLAIAIGSLAMGLRLLLLASESFRRAQIWRWLVAVGVVVAVVVFAAVASRRLDAEVLTEATKSFRYRWEYWQATLDMIGEFPVLGVGPGDFQNYYTKYKLPQASEEVRDPHNLFLEVWATGGTFAFVALALALVGFAWKTWQVSRADAKANGDSIVEWPSPSAVRLVAVGGLGGALIAYVVGFPFGFALSIGQLIAALVLGAFVLLMLWPWVIRGNLPRYLPALGLLVLVLDLSTAGGIAFPGVAGTFWILMALGLNQGQTVPATRASAQGARRWPTVAALVITIAAAAGCYYSAFLPVFAMRAAMAKSEEPRLSDAQRAAALLEAQAADPFSIEPPIAVAQLSLKYLRRNPKSEIWGQQFLAASAAVVAQCGHSSAVWRELAKWNREIYAIPPTPEMADRIVQLARGAAYMYPNSAIIQAEYALALAEGGKHAAARRVANTALELDGQTPHRDKKLPADVKERLRRILAEPTQATPHAPSVVK